MKIKYVIYGALFLLLAYLVYHRISKNATGATKNVSGKEPVIKAVNVSGVVVRPRDFSSSLSVSGSIEANEQVQIRSQIPGLVSSIAFQEGSFVQKGQVLLKIDDTELQAQLSQALTKQHLAEENEKRAGLLLTKEAISKEEYEISLSDLHALKAQTAIIAAQLAKTTVRAPFSGKIGLRNISTGGYLTPDLVIANLVSLNPLKITFSVPEKYANKLGVNARLSFTVADSDKKFHAVVYALEPSIDAATRTLQLRAKANNDAGQLIPGSFATIDLPLAQLKDAILIPTEAVVPVQNGQKVFVSDHGKAKEVKVETSSRTTTELLITSGLKAGDTVITSGVMSMKAGVPVKVRVATSKSGSKS